MAAVPSGGLKPAPTPLIGYLRVSKVREEMISPDLQRSAIRDWCARNNRTVVAWLEDLDESGRHFAKRKIAEGIAAVEAGVALEIGVYRYDRWGRHAADSLANIARVELVGGRVVSVTEPFDADTAVGKYGRTNALALAEMASDLIGENWRAAGDHRVARGLPRAGTRRYGYTYSARNRGGDGTHTPDPATGPVLAECYRRYIAGAATHAIAMDLNAAGHRTTAGNRWSQITLRLVMDSGFAAGLLIHNNTRHRAVTDGVVHFTDGAHTPLIDRDTWEAYLARRKTVAARYPRLRKGTHRLSGLLVCAHCGGPCSHSRRTRGTRTRAWVTCSRRANLGVCQPWGHDQDDVESAVLTWLGEQVDAGDAATLRRKHAALARAARISADVGAMERERKDAERALLRLTDGWARELVPDAAYRPLRDRLGARMSELDAALDAAAVPDAPIPTDALTDVVAAWESLPPAWANEALRVLVGAVIVDRERVIVLGRWELR